MTTYIAAGQRINHYSRGAVTTAPTADSLYPIAGLSDDKPHVPYKFGSNVANPYVIVDCNLLSNSDFSVWGGGTPTGWTIANTGTGAASQLSPGFGGANSALRLNAGASGEGLAYQAITCRAGEWMHVEGYISAPAAATGNVQIYNLNTAKYLNSSGAWTSSNVAWKSVTGGGTYTQITGEFQLEDFGGSQPALPSIRVMLQTSSNANVDFDDFIAYPGTNFCGFFGHNLDSVSPAFQSSTDGFTVQATTHATMTIARPAFFSVLSSMQYKRWWRFILLGTNQSTPLLGEVVIGQVFSPSRAMNYGFSVANSRPQMRSLTPGRALTVLPLSQDRSTDITMQFRHGSETAFLELADEIAGVSEDGRYPVILIPDDTRKLIVYGRLDNEWSTTHTFLTALDSGITLRGCAYPLSGL